MNFWVYALTMLANVGFYNYHNMFSIVIIRGMFYSLTLVALVLALTSRNSSLRNVDYPRGLYWTLITLISMSAMMSNIFHNQSLTTGIIATIPYVFGYLWFYILMRLKISQDRIIRFLFINVCIGAIIYFINVATFPHNIFGTPILEDISRGIQRIPIQFGEFLPLFIYYGIYRYSTSKRKKYMLLIAFCSIMIILSVVRQLIVITAIFSLWYCVKGASIYKKFSICCIATIFILVIIPRIPFYNDIMELTEKQLEDSNENEEDIRIQAWRYYTYESWENPVTTLFGNGIPAIGKSKYGNTFETNANATECFAEDVGYAGFLYYFGVVTTLILLIFLIKSCIRHTPPGKQFLSIYLVQITISSIISAPILYFQSIIGIATILYMIYHNDDTAQLSDGCQYNHLRNLEVHHSTPLRSLSAKTDGK